MRSSVELLDRDDHRVNNNNNKYIYVYVAHCLGYSIIGRKTGSTRFRVEGAKVRTGLFRVAKH